VISKLSSALGIPRTEFKIIKMNLIITILRNENSNKTTKMVNYENSVIYKLCCKDISVKEIYVGATTCFRSRKWSHKSACCSKNGKQRNRIVYKFIRENGGWDNWDMVQIEEYCAKDKKDLLSRERHWLENLGATLNKEIPLRTIKEWTADNKERIKVQSADWYQKNKDKIKVVRRKYLDANKDKITKKRAEYYQENKPMFNEYYQKNKDNIIRRIKIKYRSKGQKKFNVSVGVL
jgi:hypothetical protein